jgi:outer membrane protein OmpA-like peptidoglycan-associated protein
LYKILSCIVLFILTGCGAGSSIQMEPPAMQRGVAQGVKVEGSQNEFQYLQKYGIVIADSREGTHVILPSDRLFVRTVPDVVIEPDFYTALNDLVRILNVYPKVKIAVVGHTTDVMSAKMQEEVSLNEARVVADYLTAAGITSGRIRRIEGMSDRQPIAPNNFMGRQLNRRVEVIVGAPLR